jgi:hypothetical protein
MPLLPDPTATAQVRLGRFAFNPGMVFSTGYDSDPYREPGGTATSETYVIPQIEGWLRGGRAQVDVWGAVEIVSFSKLVGFQNWQAGGRLWWFGTWLRPRVSYNQRNTNAGVTGYEVGHTSMRREGDLQAAVDAGLGGRFGLSGSVRSTRTNWNADAIYRGSDLHETLNRRTYGANGALRFSVTPLTSLQFGVTRVADRFVYSPVRDADQTLVLGGLEMASPAIVQGSVSLGYRWITSPIQPQLAASALAGSGMLRYGRPSGLFLSAYFSRDLEYSYDPSLAYYFSNMIGVTAILPLSIRWRLQGFWETSHISYPRAADGTTVPLYRVTEYGGAGGVRILGRGMVGLTVDHAQAFGSEGWSELRVVAFFTYGSGTFQRLDRPIPFSR